MTTSNLSYRQLEAVVTVAEWGNISHAAVQLAMSQPALSRMVSTVEG
ncbi:MAG: LysR family transcriptional regulator, partial [Acidimicrobiia bacterium]|nr:LysR family transcriptional regulator [Acidimicrobiia bacterium]